MKDFKKWIQKNLIIKENENTIEFMYNGIFKEKEIPIVLNIFEEIIKDIRK